VSSNEGGREGGEMKTDPFLELTAIIPEGGGWRQPAIQAIEGRHERESLSIIARNDATPDAGRYGPEVIF
jgi:hypothetical protein